VESPVGDLVDGLRVGVARLMPDAKCEVPKRETFAVTNEAKDHPELAVWGRQIGLKAGWEPCAIATFGIAAAQDLDLYAFTLEPVASFPQRLGSGTTASHRVLGKGTLVEEDAGMTPPDGQGLPLAVGGLGRPVLSL
jgi:hypothetical protein